MRRAPLERRTALTAKTELKRKTALGHIPQARSALHADSAARKATSKRRTTSAVPAKVRAALKLRSGGLCQIAAPGCIEVAHDFAHRKKVGAGGRKGAAAAVHHVPSNGLAACRSCHQFCHDSPAAAYAAGWMLREHQNPLAEPVVYRGTWCLLGDEGSVRSVEPLEEEPVPNYVQEIESRLKALTSMPLSDGQARAYAQLVLTTGTRTTMQNVHDAWAVDRNVDRPDHEDIVPFELLDPAVAEWDRPFLDLVLRVSAEFERAEAA